MGSPATAKNVLSVGSGLVRGMMGGIGTLITVDGSTTEFDVAQLDGPPASKLVDDNPCQSDVRVHLSYDDDTCYWAKDGYCDGPLDCFPGTDATDCLGAAPSECSLPSSTQYFFFSGRIAITTWQPSSLCSLQEIATWVEQAGAQCLLFVSDTLVSLKGVDINVKSGQVSPGDKKRVLAAMEVGSLAGSGQNVEVRVGSMGATEQLSTFSSKGPTPDGRFKPEVCACASLIDSLPKTLHPYPETETLPALASLSPRSWPSAKSTAPTVTVYSIVTTAVKHGSKVFFNIMLVNLTPLFYTPVACLNTISHGHVTMRNASICNGAQAWQGHLLFI